MHNLSHLLPGLVSFTCRICEVVGAVERFNLLIEVLHLLRWKFWQRVVLRCPDFIMLFESFNILLQGLIFSTIQTRSLMLQIEEKLILISKFVKNVVITVFGLIGKELESSVVFILLEHFNYILLFLILSAFRR